MQYELEHRKLRSIEKFAGIGFIAMNVIFVSVTILLGTITGSGDFAEKAKNVADAETLYRFALVAMMLGYVTMVTLSWTLYVLLRRYDEALANLAFCFRAIEVAVSTVVLSYRYVMLDFYVNQDHRAVFTIEQIEALRQHTSRFYESGFNLAGILFACGSTLFFYLLYKTRYMPRWITGLGVGASILAGVVCVVGLVFPKETWLDIGWLPSLLAEVFAGIWLIVVGTKAAKAPAKA